MISYSTFPKPVLARTRHVVAAWPLLMIAVSMVLVACNPASYGGPLYVAPKDAEHPYPLEDSGAAGYVVDCDHEPYRGGSGANVSSLPGGKSAEQAVRGFAAYYRGALLPLDGYEREGDEDGRVLFTYDVDGRTKIAIIVTENNSGNWLMETFAQCDPAEFPPSVDDELDLEIWTTKMGNRVPVGELTLVNGSTRCESERVTFLFLQTSRASYYVRDPDGVFSGDVQSSFDPDTDLPDDAADTGYRLDSWKLWLAANNANAYVVTDDGVERWPRAVGHIGCL